MQTHLTLTLSTFLLLLTFPASFFSCAAASARKHDEPRDLVRSSCVHARYPSLCLRTLSNYAGPANTPLDVAQAALKVSLAHTRRVNQYLKTLQASPGSFGQNPSNSNSNSNGSISKRQRVALSDCAEQLSDSVDQLRKSLKELQHLRPGTFEWHMSNAQTWVSAALTDGDTCLDGFGGGGGGAGGDGKVKWDVKRRVRDVTRVTSNALYMINRLGQGGTGKPRFGSISKN